MKIIVLKSADVSAVPSEIQIVPIGQFRAGDGSRFRITQDQVKAMIKNAAGQNVDIPIDYEHQTLDGVQAPAAGWIKKLVNKGEEGLWAVVEWTQRAREYLKNREYRYLSPVLMAAKKDADGFLRPLFLHSAALTNTPQIDGMVPIVNKGINFTRTCLTFFVTSWGVNCTTYGLDETCNAGACRPASANRGWMNDESIIKITNRNRHFTNLPSYDNMYDKSINSSWSADSEINEVNDDGFR